MTKEEIQKKIEILGSDNLHVFGGTYEGGINLQQIVDEITPCIFDLINQNRKFNNFLEIGAAAGGNTYLFNHIFNFNKVVIIDDNQHVKHVLRPEILKYVKPIEYIGNSHTQEALDFANNLNMKFDVMFIDGDHSYEGVKKDVEMYTHLLNVDGFLFFHDTKACEGVGREFNELIKNNKFGLEFFNEYITKFFHRPCGIGVLKKVK